MKKIILSSVLAVIVSMGLYSCSKCQTCDQISEPKIEVCENDYNSNTEYGQALDYYQSQGYNCN